MPDQNPYRDHESPVEQHVRTILAQLSALRNRLRGQQQDKQSGLVDMVEVERKVDRSSQIDDAYLPA